MAKNYAALLLPCSPPLKNFAQAMDCANDQKCPLTLVLISGLSGSGKSIALNVLEDAGYYCVDNLPATLLPELLALLQREGHSRIAVAIDMRAGKMITGLPALLGQWRNTSNIALRFLFLQASEAVLIQRFSETRRRHPLAHGDVTLAEAIARERHELQALSELGHHIDTSYLRPNALRSFVKDFISIDERQGLTLMFESFGFKHGLPLDADMIFDARCLPNPHYDLTLQPLTGCDQPVIDFLVAQPEVCRMAQDIERFIQDWLPAYIRDNRAYLTVAIGCTGGRHRSVYLVETLARAFAGKVRVLIRHRSLSDVA